MYGKCKDCAKQMSCWKPVGVRFGFCETDFEPKVKPQVPSSGSGMKWKQLSSSVWEAEGKYGKFRIERSRGLFWALYASEDTLQKFRPKQKLSEAKDFCERNENWEDAV